MEHCRSFIHCVERFLCRNILQSSILPIKVRIKVIMKTVNTDSRKEGSGFLDLDNNACVLKPTAANPSLDCFRLQNGILLAWANFSPYNDITTCSQFQIHIIRLSTYHLCSYSILQLKGNSSTIDDLSTTRRLLFFPVILSS